MQSERECLMALLRVLRGGQALAAATKRLRRFSVEARCSSTLKIQRRSERGIDGRRRGEGKVEEVSDEESCWDILCCESKDEEEGAGEMARRMWLDSKVSRAGRDFPSPLPASKHSRSCFHLHRYCRLSFTSPARPPLPLCQRRRWRPNHIPTGFPTSPAVRTAPPPPEGKQGRCVAISVESKLVLGLLGLARDGRRG